MDDSLTGSQTAECESLCIQQGNKGCCLLVLEGEGCVWKEGAGIKPSTSVPAIAITCTNQGNNAFGTLSLADFCDAFFFNKWTLLSK